MDPTPHTNQLDASPGDRTEEKPNGYFAISQEQHAGNDETSSTGNRRPHRRFPQDFALEDWWFIEAVAMFFSAVLLVCIVVALRLSEGRPQENWSSISLNTAVSWLSTWSKACVMLPVSTSLGQLKWTWFAKQPRKLVDLGMLDQASRGIIGSLRLLLSKQGLHLQAVGCIVTILAIGYSPFVQNLIHYYPRAVIDSTQVSYVANSTDFNTAMRSFGADSRDPWVNTVLKANVYSSIFNSDSTQPWSIPKYSCPSGNCTFPPLLTLAAEVECKNITQDLTTVCGPCEEPGCSTNCTASAGSTGPYLNYTFHRMGQEGEGWADGYAMAMGLTQAAWDASNLSSEGLQISTQDMTLPPFRQIEVRDFQKLINQYEYEVDSRTLPFLGTECTLRFGTQAVQDRVNNSAFHSDPMGFWPGENSTVDLFPNNASHPAIESQVRINKDDYAAIALFLQDTFSGGFYISSTTGDAYWTNENPYKSRLQYASMDIAQSISYGNLSGCATGADNLTCAMTNVAKALTKSFRDATLIAEGLVRANVTVGETYTMVSHVRIDWGWIALPVLIWVLALVLWAGTAMKARRARVPPWANSVLPLLYLYEQDERERNADQGGTANRDFMRRSDGVKAQLRVTERRALLS